MTAPAASAADHVRRPPATHPWALVAVWLASALFLLLFVERGWIRGDEGLLGQTAERVLAGELPHRDFDDMYTGGLAVAHAAAFRVLGVKLTSIRWLLYAATLVFVPIMFRVARRFASPWGAAALTAAAVVWTVPAYFAGMPSWYNLFLAVGALLALLRFIDDGRRRWLVIAGLFAGTSFLFKSAALLLIAGILLFLVFREQEEASARAPSTPSRAFALVTTMGLAAFVAVLVRFVFQQPSVMAGLLFVVPGSALATFLTIRAWRRPTGPFRRRAARLLALGGWIGVGLVVPLTAFAAWFAAAGSLGALLDPRFLFETKRLTFTTFPLPSWKTVLFVTPFAALLAWPLLLGSRPALERRWLAPAALVATLAAALGAQGMVYQSVWFSLRPMVPALALIGLATLISRRVSLDATRRQQVFLLLAVTSVVSVMQFPYAWGLYFCYFAPLVILTTAALVKAAQGAAPRRLHACQLALYLGFGLLWVDFANAETHGWYFERRQQEARFDNDRAGLYIPEGHAQAYRLLIAAVHERVPEGQPILALPDCPEVYFLTGRPNPTPTLGDYFDDDFGTPARTARLLRLLEERQIDLVVLHWRPAFSGEPVEFARALRPHFPHQLRLEPFTIHWRDRPGPSDADDGIQKAVATRTP